MKKIIISLFCVILLLSSHMDVDAYSTYLKKNVLTGGIYNRRYYAVPNDYWRLPIKNAIYNWYNTSTRFYFVETTDASLATLRYDTYSANDSSNGYTEFFATSGSRVDHNAVNWNYTKVYLNRFYLANTSTAYDDGVAGHEVGHAVGLAHSKTKTVIMCTAGDGRSVTKPQTDDINGVNSLYKIK